MERIHKIQNHPVYKEEYRLLTEAEKERFFCRHTMEHFLDVARLMYIKNLEEQAGLDKELIYAAALLHDIGRYLQLTEGIPHQQAGEHMTDPGAFPGVLPPVIQTASHGEQDKKRQPRQMQGRVHCKALTGRNGIDRVEKILKHSHHPLSEYLEVPGTVYDSRPVQM